MAGEDKPVLGTSIPRETTLILVWVFFAICTMLLICRFAIRLWLHRQLFWDDIFAAIGYVLLLGHDVVATMVTPAIYMMIGTYTGRPKPPDFLDQVTYLVKLMFTANILFILCLYSVKASLLALLWRLVKNLTTFRRGWWAITVITAIGALATIILAPISCSDLRAFGCTSPKDIERDLITVRFTAASDILTDLLIMSLPVAFILTSYLPTPQKIGLIGLFALGFTVIAMSILRIVVNDNKSKHPPPAWLLFWSAMESTVAVMVSCFASFKSLFTLRKRPSAYLNDTSYLQSKSKSGRSEARNSIALRSRNRFERSPGATKADMNTVVISSEGEPNKWSDDGSREEILQRTEVEVRYESASIPGQSTVPVAPQP
ncbi:hypothetical protein CPC735_037250 [Coccidioides posadasii C735 delta SOWgp]|uniref:Rhodopsin domain-containing protein n=1 Tax=Coccidioides posadasii (strain C735) TaxID=222929 RepID=C5P2B6_COCP7|nr:hypothetical protein CPC735_037250 [Coccidioides posadasii C735 delta SOWgp]EER29019.1 hypothetical protein CPC735_037250 [Coccidioides posadasii C735 delta SOWgp]|eukprot:XP_003071164.1 hypothetical protein CPC735_037250 [Coccidioides posadasii C735 delta SOWgp]